MIFRISLCAPFLVMLITLPGCFSTHLIDQASTAELQRLVHSTGQHISLRVHNPHAGSSHGYQFLLGIVPLSRIFADQLEETVTAQLQYRAGIAGIGLRAPTLEHKKRALVEVVVTSVDINGYDLVVFRRPSASITLQGTLSTADGTVRLCEERGEYAETTRFAFSPQLNQVLAKATSLAAGKLVECLGLSSSDQPSSAFDAEILGQGGDA